MLHNARWIAVATLVLSACSGDSTGNNEDTGTGADTSPAGDVITPRDVTAMDAARDVAADRVVPVDVRTGVDVPAADARPDASAPDDVQGTDAAVGTDSASACGVCAAGFSCGPGGYCVTADGVPAFGRVFLVVMENHSLSSIMGSSSAPYINGLMNTYSYASRYVTRASGAIHPSLPNYVALTAGDTLGIDCDCSPAAASLSARASCITARTSSSCPQNAMHVGDRFDTAGVAWRAYGEDMGSPCNTTDSGNYVTRHVPFLYYNNVRTDTARCALRTRDYHDFAADLAAGTYRFSMISPNLCNDMHGNGVLGFGDTCGGTNAINNGDRWLAAQIPAILATRGFQADGTDVLFIVWDEEDNSTGAEPLPLIVVSPLVHGGMHTTTPYDHYSLLGTITAGLGATRIGTAEALAAPAITDVWR